jgi:hypothetical protein
MAASCGFQGIWQAGSVQPTRRSVLAAGVLGLGAACTSTRKATPGAVDPDVALTEAARNREHALLDAYTAVTAAFPQLSGELSALATDHAQHLAALGPSTASGQATSTPSASTAPSGPHPRAALTRLAALEGATAKEHGEAAVVASRALAPVLASLAACEASHVAVLRLP